MRKYQEEEGYGAEAAPGEELGDLATIRVEDVRRLRAVVWLR